MFFKSLTLKMIGLCVQLGHQISEHCVNPKPAIDDDFVDIDNNGIHQVGVDYCSCEKALPQVEQVLCAHWYPATSNSQDCCDIQCS
jgi:CxC2 like cysteine cluster associated with KDZ transposases